MNILVGFDGSNVAKDAVVLAGEHAKAFKGRVFVVRSMLGGIKADQQEYIQAERGLDHAKWLMKEMNVPCEIRLLVRGMSPGEDLVKFSLDNKVDEIVIGVRQRSKLGKLIFGSTSQYVILNSFCPVVTVK